MPTSSSHPKAARLSVLLAFLSVYIFWGATFIATKIGVQAVPAPILAGVRMTIAGILMLGFCAICGKQLLWSRGTMLRLALLGVLMLSGGNVGLVWAEVTLAAGLSALLVAIVPVYVATLEWLLPGGERLRGAGLSGIVLGVLALVALLWPSLHHGVRGEMRQLLAAAALLGGALSFAVGSVTSRRMRLPVDPLVAAGWEMLAAGILNLAAGTVLGEWREAQWTTQSISAIGFLVIFGSLLGFTCYIWLIHHVPVAKVATYAYVNPVVAVILGAIFLAERLEPTEYIGMVLVVIAVVLVTSSSTSGGKAEATVAAVESGA